MQWFIVCGFGDINGHNSMFVLNVKHLDVEDNIYSEGEYVVDHNLVDHNFD